MQINFLPPKLITKIDRLQRNFLWGTTDQKRKIHLINWDKCTSPKSEGGLGIQKLIPKNKSILTCLLSATLILTIQFGSTYYQLNMTNNIIKQINFFIQLRHTQTPPYMKKYDRNYYLLSLRHKLECDQRK